MNILTVNLIFSTFVFWLAARFYLVPRFSGLTAKTVLMPILLLHGMRHLGLMFLAPGAIYPGIPDQFTYPAAFGDLIAAVLAILAFLALARNLALSRALVWVFNIEGSLDLVAAIALATLYGAPPFMGPAYWIPAFWVPALIVTHIVTFIVLLQHWPSPSSPETSAKLERQCPRFQIAVPRRRRPFCGMAPSLPPWPRPSAA